MDATANRLRILRALFSPPGNAATRALQAFAGVRRPNAFTDSVSQQYRSALSTSETIQRYALNKRQALDTEKEVKVRFGRGLEGIYFSQFHMLEESIYSMKQEGDEDYKASVSKLQEANHIETMRKISKYASSFGEIEGVSAEVLANSFMDQFNSARVNDIDPRLTIRKKSLGPYLVKRLDRMMELSSIEGRKLEVGEQALAGYVYEESFSQYLSNLEIISQAHFEKLFIDKMARFDKTPFEDTEAFVGLICEYFSLKDEAVIDHLKEYHIKRLGSSDDIHKLRGEFIVYIIDNKFFSK